MNPHNIISSSIKGQHHGMPHQTPCPPQAMSQHVSLLVIFFPSSVLLQQPVVPPHRPNQVNTQRAGASVTSHTLTPPSHVSMPTNHVGFQGLATTMCAPEVCENASQTPLSPPAASPHTHPTPTAMTLNSMILDDPPPQVYVPPGGSSLPALSSSTYAPQITMCNTPVGIQSATETAHIPPTNHDPHPISYPMPPQTLYGMHAPSSSMCHP